ncbi:hypothetical protein ANN_03822 [Periplaneta americana]|uniref:DUF4817 domain-containing protein n=1 Tax=Periplaneta americana TaxID=6978 RepID=A0ABQ8U277_PERAM|nr:hypothetical protein ANN_03822 [Periplaneta americana]
MERLPVQQRIFCVEQFVSTESIVAVQREFRRIFGDNQRGVAPSRKNNQCVAALCFPDLTAPDFFLWGYLKSKIYGRTLHDIEDLKTEIREEIADVTPETLRRVMAGVQEDCNNALTQMEDILNNTNTPLHAIVIQTRKEAEIKPERIERLPFSLNQTTETSENRNCQSSENRSFTYANLGRFVGGGRGRDPPVGLHADRITAVGIAIPQHCRLEKSGIRTTQRAYQREFGVRNPPKRNTILGLVNKLETTGSLVSEKDKHRSSRLPTVVVDVRARLEQSPKKKKSLRRLSQERGTCPRQELREGGTGTVKMMSLRAISSVEVSEARCTSMR